MSGSIVPFRADVDNSTVDDLRLRLSRTRWPDQGPAPSWSQGVPVQVLRDMATYWHSKYDMSRLPKELNQYAQFVATIVGYRIHFLRVKSQTPNAIPLLLVHGWPGSVLEFRHVIKALNNPQDPRTQAFDLVIPSLPGYGYSSVPHETGCTPSKVGEIFHMLMDHLGYLQTGYYAQGGDWGADIVAEMAHAAFPGLRGVHMNSAFFDIPLEIARDAQENPPVEPTPDVQKAQRLHKLWSSSEEGYFKQQSTRPQTLAYGLADSPIGLLAWLYEKIVLWASPRPQNYGTENDQVRGSLDIDEVLDNVMLYWTTNTIASSMRLYWEAVRDSTALEIPPQIAVGVSLFPHDPSWTDRRWCERYYRNLVYWNVVEEGGHFAAWEQPEIFVREVREFIKKAMR